MLEHVNDRPSKPARVVVLGAAGFVGGAVAKRLAADGTDVLDIGRDQLDLLAPDAAARLADALRPDDTMVIAAARAPCKTPAMMLENVSMMHAICAAFATVLPAHIVYVSSDAVYADEPTPLTEVTPAAPQTLHGAMHLVRELMLRESCPCPLAILRPTLIYGAADPHDGYGPNRFRRLAAAGKPIRLFGNGEERRDHVLIDDVAEIVRRAVLHRSRGVLNVATGVVVSFRDIAESIAALHHPRPAIETVPRGGPMPHNGYRPFDPAATRIAFPDFRYTPPAEGLRRVHAALAGQSVGAA